MGSVFGDIGTALIGLGISTLVLPGRSYRRMVGWVALGGVCYCISDFLPPDTTRALVDGALTTYNAWCWWNSGGGDGTKRRLKQWAAKFRGVRRTAPAMGGA